MLLSAGVLARGPWRAEPTRVRLESIVPSRPKGPTLRRLTLVGLALLVVPALAYSGTTVTDANDTLKIKARFDPAKASKKRGPLRPTELKYDYFAGTTNDKRLSDLRSVRVYPGGASVKA